MDNINKKTKYTCLISGRVLPSLIFAGIARRSRAMARRRRGFSITEIVVVVAIMMIMTAVLLSNQGKNKSQQSVETAARQVAAELRQLQTEAMSGKQIGTPAVSVCDFKFDADGTAVYKISYNDCSKPVHLLLGSAKPVNINAQKSVNVGSVSIFFSAPMGRMGGGATQQVILTSATDITKKASVCVCSSGNIFEKNDTVSCSDPSSVPKCS
jgi:type II secretory pathway pseudopilin PulG